MRFETTYQTFAGAGLPAMRTEMSVDQAHRMIGANLLAGFDTHVHTKDAKGEQLRTREGIPLTVVALHGARVISAMEFVHVGY
ncbi:hypothetical protein OID55_41930 (plasmid) [Streptomyces sp. NBC_00715]|uniref:hypothetical protein n=1 Tax=Streptomyces sp. NBC_00715 TaxID=2975811 RepID=UPI002F9113CA